MSIYQFLQVFLFMIVIGTLVVSGWFFSTRGEEEVLPDGSIERTGRIFKGWYFFWMKKHPIKKKIYYMNDQLQNLLSEINSNYPSLGVNRVGVAAFSINNEKGYSYDLLQTVADGWKIKITNKGDNFFCAYKEYDDYVFPWWVRDPMAKCATCFASVYGSLFYWLILLLIDDGDKLFYWSSSPIWAILFFWISFCFSLAVLNTAFAKKFN